MAKHCLRFCKPPDEPSIFIPKNKAKVGNVVLKGGLITTVNKLTEDLINSNPVLGFVVSPVNENGKIKIAAMTWTPYTFGAFLDDGENYSTVETIPGISNLTTNITASDAGRIPSDFYLESEREDQIEGTEYYYNSTIDSTAVLSISLDEILNNANKEVAISDVDGYTNTENLIQVDIPDEYETLHGVEVVLIKRLLDEVDWYLPAIGELALLFLNFDAAFVQPLSNLNGTSYEDTRNDFDQVVFMSSTTINDQEIWSLNTKGTINYLPYDDLASIILFAEI